MAACLQRDHRARMVYSDEPEEQSRRGCPTGLAELYTDDTNVTDALDHDVYLYEPIDPKSTMAYVVKFSVTTGQLTQAGEISCNIFKEKDTSASASV